MANATHDLPALPWAGNAGSFADAGLFALIAELRNCEKRRDDLLARWSSDNSDQVRAVAEKACDACPGDLRADRRKKADNSGRGIPTA
jgi:hypothetical protein